MRVLGLHAVGHDAGACLLENGGLVAMQEDRLSRLKNDGGFPSRAIDYVLGGDDLRSVDLVVMDVCDGTTARARAALAERGYRGRVLFVNHHRAHAAGAHFVEPEDGAAILVVDAGGTRTDEWPRDVPRPPELPRPGELVQEVQSFYVARGRAIELVHQTFTCPRRPLGLGWLWAVTTVYLGFGPLDAGKTMGLAAHAPAGEDDVVPWGSLGGDLLFDVELDVSQPESWARHRDRLFGGLPPRRSGEPLEEAHARVAARLQRTTERFLSRAAEQLHRATGARTLCFSGGVALNVIANRVLRDSSPFERVVVQPAAGDSGIALGCALLGAIDAGTPLPPAREFSFTGRPPDAQAVGAALELAASRGLRVRRSPEVLDEIVTRLCAGELIGWLEGPSELGPRALGHRSLFADPRDPASKDRVNARVKRRESFRPFAPIVMEERAAEWFDVSFSSRDMLFSATVHPEKRPLIPAVTHVDGTARVQTVPASFPGSARELLERFEARTGVPVLLNTSLNGPGEPLIEAPDDAVELFARSRMDALFLEGALVTRG